ncbi:MAG TPA: Gfo/Idh/MocA family oxidoreductase [Acidimicrobiales bacterium]|nr:Gfo/Idh/MocA family oxidoreductase [Acidimicrobiales bacterium]
MKAAVVGCGAVGARVARQLLATSTVDEVILWDTAVAQAVAVARALGDHARVDQGDPHELPLVDVLVLATPAQGQLKWARNALRRGIAVVSLTDSVEEVQLLLGLSDDARAAGVSVVVGAGFCPGLSCVLARFAAERFDSVDEIHVAKFGTGGPACARQHHRALSGAALDWRDQKWVRRRGGSGRELLWFPEPVVARDCYRAALADALLLVPSFPDATRITSRISATRRDRLTARFPMLRPPHPEGRSGAVRVELRGRREGTHEVAVIGATQRTAVGAAAVAATAAAWTVAGRFPAGAAGLAAMVEPRAFLADLMDRGIRIFSFDGRPRREV